MEMVTVKPVDLPGTLEEWEAVLTAHLLVATDGENNAVRSFEMSADTLAACCGLDATYSETAETAFRIALLSDPNLFWCLQHGRAKPGNDRVSNCLAILVLSLLVDGLLDGDDERKGQYRAKLTEWLQVDRTFNDLRGLNIMWTQLAAWLDSRIAGGASLRRLDLPRIPATWTHIGYTRFLSFPAKRDVSLITRKLGSAVVDLEAPALVRKLESVASTPEASPGLKDSYNDFRSALRSGAASVEHRFWRLVLLARAQMHREDAAACTLVMNFDEDGMRVFKAESAGGEVGEWVSLSVAISQLDVARSSNLSSSIRRGVLFFRACGLASWIAAGQPHPGDGPFHLAVANSHLGLAAGEEVAFAKSGTWSVTSKPISARMIKDVLSLLGFMDAQETVRTVMLAPGIRVGRAWLGQPNYLPYLEGAPSQVLIRRVGSPDEGGLSWADGKLSSDEPIEGQFIFSDSAAHWSRRATFVALAECHPHLTSSAYKVPADCEWKTSATARTSSTACVEFNWDSTPCRHQDMLEALYASARSGLSEAEAISIISRSFGRSWEVLRALQESSFFDGRPRQRWKGRVFTLVRPALAAVRFGHANAVIVLGAIPSRLEADFLASVGLQGGQPLRRVAEAGFSVPFLGAVGVDAALLSAALGWSVVEEIPIPDGTHETRLIETKIAGEGYRVAAHWDWDVGRFRQGGPSDNATRLTRLVHPGGRDHDIYRVIGTSVRSFSSRHVAILEAYKQSGRPLFSYEDGYIKRLQHEGALPLEISSALRMRTLSNVEVVDGGWRYAASKTDARWIAELIPSLVRGAGGDTSDQIHGAAVRGRSHRRPIWSQGRVVV